MKNLFPVFFALIFSLQISFAQNKSHPVADSLQQLIDKAPDDTNKVLLEHKAFMEYMTFDTEKAMAIAQDMLALSKKLNYDQGIIKADDNIARTYWTNHDLPNALKTLQDKLDICEKVGSQYAIAQCYNNLGVVSRSIKNPDQAIEYYRKALAIFLTIKDTSGMASSYGNIGSIYSDKKDKKTAIAYFKKARDLRLASNDYKSVVIQYINIGKAYLTINIYDSAKIALDSAALLCKRFGNEVSLADVFQGLGAVYHGLKQYDQALAYQDSAIRVARKMGMKDVIITCYGELSEVEEERGNFKAALDWQREKFALNDSSFNENMSGQIAEMETKYNSEKQKRENDKLKNEAQHTAVVNKLLYTLAALGLLVAIAFFYAYRNKRKSNILLASQNEQIEMQKKEITDSITYAQRIQQAILPHENALAHHFPNSFVLYLPKAIVSGDFWWMNEVDAEMQIAVADCTGHGVPGAFMSMLGVDKLTSIAQTKKEPDQVLSELNRSIKQTLQQVEGNGEEVRDGMDIVFVKFNREKNNFTFAGANRPVWIFGADYSSRELKPTKAAIGGHTSDTQEFDLSSIPLQKGETIYLFSDGFADQFGGPKGKKIMTGRMREWLGELQKLPMKNQREELLKRFSEWKGKNEQVDDVMVIGIRV